ncbi:GTPase Era [Cumulibacter manganitolerans]|uniref:GTPase Era n=1 Tax=Cumulibacter manganitolerans TaxID=1884992 RepID=UPI001295C644|nr:GTPase Era [Cumulibacter manganitolerans]
MSEPEHRSGFVSFVGRPNAGKSTLTNALVGQKVAITSDKPQTTRHAVRGIVNRPAAQVIIVDTPGLHRPRTLLGERLNDVVTATLSEVDVIGFCLPAGEKIGPGDRFIARMLRENTKAPVIGIVTKTDTASSKRIMEALLAVQGLQEELGREFADIVPTSATEGVQTDLLLELIEKQLPEGPRLFLDDEPTDESTETLIAEFIREAALSEVRDELPHSIACAVEEMLPREDSDIVDVHAFLYVERSSQKPIILGPRGSRIKKIGTEARRQIEQRLGMRIYLHLHVSVLSEWQRDPKKLHRLGF